MATIQLSIEIARPPEAVFDYVTTGRNWLAWHPATIAVEGDTDHSAKVGEEIIETVRVGFMRGVGTWKVEEYERPARWVIASVDPSGRGEARLVYALERSEGVTIFERTLTYSLDGIYALVDRLYLRRVQRTQSARALDNLKSALERGGT